jgi:hypothetical protein
MRVAFRPKRDGELHPYAGADATREPRYRALTTGGLEGRPTRMGEVSRGNKTSYLILVSTGPGQSFQITALNSGIHPPGPHTLLVGQDFATTILKALNK